MVVLTYQEFVELFNDLPAILRKTKSMEGKDQIIRKIFSNFVLQDKKVASYQLKPPFDVLLKQRQQSLSVGDGRIELPTSGPPAQRSTDELIPVSLRST